MAINPGCPGWAGTRNKLY